MEAHCKRQTRIADCAEAIKSAGAFVNNAIMDLMLAIMLRGNAIMHVRGLTLN